ncbi:DUF2637 domain-containing protein [Streptacidiphilus sp. P02-A3a]|uniref:DUF2637 domain-containing protein n=1 Tax=Streptacidiphilus sp. P02-A3a TaxID=2704468 RepID=UPI0015F99BCF|nr:DUF2637 domain-containing protein [Streptacidiphilus sp. P02-A3a]QMU67128.1 DUF2637 domain-containing protein [Streptacidiphilus sp. P02-A3a]
MPTTTQPPAPTTRTGRATRWDRRAIAVLGTLGFALSYSALQQMATAAHVLRPLSYAYPPLVDGFIAYGVRAVLVLRTAPLPARLYAWALLAAATSASIWANALHALDLNTPGTTQLHLTNPAVVVLSAIPPLALGGATHLHVLITRYGGTSPTPASAAPDTVLVAASRTTPQVPDRADKSTRTPIEVLDGQALAPQAQPAIEAPAAGREAAPQAAAGTPNAHQAAVDSGRAPEPPQPAGGRSGAGQGPQEGSGPRPQPSQGGRPPKATLEQLAQAISAAHPDAVQITRDGARKAVTDAGLGAGHGRLNEAITLVRRRTEVRQHAAQD